jgi:hypothetical protein
VYRAWRTPSCQGHGQVSRGLACSRGGRPDSLHQYLLALTKRWVNGSRGALVGALVLGTEFHAEKREARVGRIRCHTCQGGLLIDTRGVCYGPGLVMGISHLNLRDNYGTTWVAVCSPLVSDGEFSHGLTGGWAKRKERGIPGRAALWRVRGYRALRPPGRSGPQSPM